MFQSITGTVIEFSPCKLILENNGLGYCLSVSGREESFKLGSTVQLWTHILLRDDSFEIFGFTLLKEKQFFLRLLKVSGIGPRTALALLTCFSIEQMIQIVQSENAKQLTKVPGIGIKGAKKLLAELSGDSILSQEQTVPMLNEEQLHENKHYEIMEDVTQALRQLGLNKTESEKRFNKVFTKNPNLSKEECLRFCLQLGS